MCKATNDVDAIHPLSIDWYSPEGIKFKTNGSYVIVHTTTNPATGQVQSVLLFDPVNHTDSGEYTCHAFNDIDCYTEDKTNLTVECKVIVDQVIAVNFYNNYLFRQWNAEYFCICKVYRLFILKRHL